MHLGTYKNFASTDEARRCFRETIRNWSALTRRLAGGNIETAATVSLRGGGASIKNTPRKAIPASGLQAISSQLAVITNIVEQLNVNFKDDKAARKLVTQVEAFRKTVQEKYDALESQIGKASANNASSEFKKLFSSLQRVMKDRLKGKFSDFSVKVLSDTVIRNGGKELHTAGYVKLTNVQTDNKFAYDEYYGILTEVNASGSLSYHLTLSPAFSLPGRYVFDAEVKNTSQLKALVDDQLTIDKFSSIITPRAIPLSADRVKKLAHDNVNRVTVKNDRIIVYLKAKLTDEQVQETRNALKIQIGSLVSATIPGNRDVIRDVVMNVGTAKTIQYIFTLTKALRKNLNTLNSSKLHKLQNMLSLTDSQVQKIRQSLENE